MTSEQVDDVLDVHLRGAFNVTRPAWRRMREQGYGRVVSTTSASGLFGSFGQANYGAAKTGLLGFTRVLAAEGRSHGITANAIAPIARTRMNEKLLSAKQEELDPKYVSPVVAYLAHETAAVTGELFSVAGGYVARVFVGITEGIFAGGSLSPEVVGDRLDKICDEVGYYVPTGPGDEVKRVYPRL
jgi:NAD(P)-dependent dehydrogenase (short-subunit alcohol dehydrogenase family)